MIGVTLMEKVYVVIPSWNAAEMIGKALRSLQKQSAKHVVIVVENGSVDDSAQLIEEQFPSVILLKQERNHGFAGGVNIGIRYALDQGAEAIALFNNDALADKDWLRNLVDTMKTDKKIGIVSCKQLRTDKKYIDSTGDFYSIWGLPFPRGRNQKDEGQYNRQEEVFSAPAGATLYSAEMFTEIGLFDERFFAYYEDVDISFRARLKGWKILYEPSAKVYHAVSATSSRLGSFTRYHSTKNFFMLYAKNMPGLLYWKYLPLFTIQAARLLVGSLVRREGFAYVRGVLRAFMNTPHLIKERKRIQRSRVVSTEFIDRQLYHDRPPRIPAIHTRN